MLEQETLSVESNFGTNMFPTPAWNALWYFSNSEFFQRMWIRQEACLAKEVVFIHQGHMLQFSTGELVSRGLVYLSDRLWKTAPEESIASKIGPYIIASLKIWKYDTILLLAKLRSQIRSSVEVGLRQKWGRSLLAGETHATNPKDYIYGLLGIDKLEIVPDYRYESSLATVFSGYVSKWLQECGALESGDTGKYSELDKKLFFLNLGGRCPSSLDVCIPSWAPAYHVLQPLTTYVLPSDTQCSSLPLLETASEPLLEEFDLSVSASFWMRLRLWLATECKNLSRIVEWLIYVRISLLDLQRQANALLCSRFTELACWFAIQSRTKAFSGTLYPF
jgi:hypothetical protein